MRAVKILLKLKMKNYVRSGVHVGGERGMLIASPFFLAKRETIETIEAACMKCALMDCNATNKLEAGKGRSRNPSWSLKSEVEVTEWCDDDAQQANAAGRGWIRGVDAQGGRTDMPWEWVFASHIWYICTYCTVPQCTWGVLVHWQYGYVYLCPRQQH